MISLLLPAFLAFLTFPAIPAIAQEVGSANLGCFAGLNDSQSPAVLPECESPDLINTESNLDASAILKRKGYQLYATLTVTTGPITGTHSFVDGSGNNQVIVCNDRYCAHSVNGNAFANFLSTAGGTGAVPRRWSMVDTNGIVYMANDRRDPIMRYDGTTASYPTGPPHGSILELTQDRMAVGDISGQPNRVHYSSAGAYEQFTTGVNPQDSFYDDFAAAGDRVRGIRCIQANCFIFKSASITLCEMADQYNTQCAVISPSIGTTDPASIVTAGSSLMFRAQDKNYWEIGTSGLRQISKKIPNLVKSQSGGLGGGEQSNTQTSKSDWDAGTQSPSASWDTTSQNGSIFPSSPTFVDTSSADWVQNAYNLNIDTLTDAGSVRISSSSYNDDWANTLVAGNLAWATSGGSWTNLTDPPLTSRYVMGNTGANNDSDLQNIILTSSVTLTSGRWDVVHHIRSDSANCSNGGFYTGLNTCFEFRIIANAAGDYIAVALNSPSSTRLASIVKNISGVRTVLTNRAVTYANMTDYSWSAVVTGDGSVYLYIDGIYLSSSPAVTTISNPSKVEIAASMNSGFRANLFTAFHAYQYKSSGTLLSRTFDSNMLSPVWGALSSTYTFKTGEGQVNFYTQTSNDGTNWDSYLASSDTYRFNPNGKRYGRYKMDLFTFLSTATPTVTDVRIVAASTGTFRTQCIQPNSSISAWGALSCAQTVTGNASIVYYATGAASCALLPSSSPDNWQTTATNNATLGISLSSAVYIGFRSLLTSATEQAQIDSCILNWNEGTPTQPSWAAYDSIKNAVYWTSTVGGASSSNRLLKYDRNLEQWYPFDIGAQAPRVINNNLYFGSATGGYLYLYGGVDSDAGANINAYWKSRDIGNDPFREKSFKTLSILSRNNGSGTMTGTWTLSNSQTGSYSVSLSTGSGINYARSNYNLPIASPQSFISIRIGNNSTTPFEVLGIGTSWVTLPWKVSGP